MSDSNGIGKFSGISSATDLAMLTRGNDLQAKAEKLSRQLMPGQEMELSSKGKDSPQDIEKAATDFEALLLQQMFKSMWESVPKDGLLSGSREEELYRDMLNEQLSKDISEKQSIGIKEVISSDMKKLAEKH